jgi:hypothetical protein
LSVAGGIAQSNASLAMGEASQKQAEYKAKQLEQQSNEARAAAQRVSEDERHKLTIAQSSMQARAASQGAGATDDTVIKLDEDLAGKGEYNALGEMYNGENRARGIQMQADSSRFDGQIAKMGYESKASASLIQGFGDAFGSFAKSSPFKTA